VGSLEKEVPVLKEDRRHRESKNNNRRALIILGVVAVGFNHHIFDNQLTVLMRK
jgi:hypothetical protein